MGEMREPIAVNRFYSGNPEDLKRTIVNFLKQDEEKIQVKGLVSPHAGFMYSGAVAGATFSKIKPADVYVILGPNHTGYGTKVSISGEDSWKTPLGEVKIDDKIRETLLQSSDILKINDDAHKFEHSIEVQLPFIQMLNENFSFVPIVIKSSEKNIYKKLARALSESIKQVDKNVVIIASSDMTHYEPHETAKKKDSKVIKKMLSLDSEAVFDTVISQRITMCGYMPVTVMLASCKTLGAYEAKLIDYQTSGDVTGDKSSVVGYTGIIVY